MRLMTKVLQRDAAELAAEGVRLRFIGDMNGLPPYLQDEIARWEKCHVMAFAVWLMQRPLFPSSMRRFCVLFPGLEQFPN